MRGIGSIMNAAKPVAARSTGRGGFTVRLAAGGTASGVEHAAAATAIGGGLLALQERGEETARDSTAARRATSLLAELQGLQADLLRGDIASGRLARLAALGDGEDGADPSLRDAVQAIGLRARIELARQGWPEAGRRPVSAS